IIYRISRDAAAASEPITGAIGPVVTVEGVDYIGSAFLCPDHEGGMWLGAEKGLWRIQPQTVRVFSRRDGLLDENVYPIYQDRSGVIWAGIWPNTLANYEKGTFRTFLRAPGTTGLIASLFQDASGRFWFGGGGRVHYLQGDKPVDFTPQLGSSGEEVSVISQDSGGALWFGAARGLIRYSDGRVTRFTTKDGLPDNSVTSFLQTRDGNIWIGTHGGVAIIDPSLGPRSQAVIRALTENDGLAADHTRCIYQ